LEEEASGFGVVSHNLSLSGFPVFFSSSYLEQPGFLGSQQDVAMRKGWDMSVIWITGTA
jgi:hypothetical protein